MKKILLSGIALAVATFGVVDVVYAHGGQYRGPGDTVPPNPGGRGGRTPGPSGPSTPGPGGPSTPGPGGPSTPGPGGPGTGGPGGPGPAGGPVTGGMDVGDDLNRWEFWWEFNKDPFIKLKQAVHTGDVVSDSDEFYLGSGTQKVATDTLKPSEAQILNTILPKLSQALESTDQRDIVSSCMVAMAKVGKNTDQINILDAFKKKLTEKDQEVRETAAVALGISQMTEAVPTLLELSKDTPAGRKLCDRDSVDYRTRSFSIYGLGLVAFATADHAVKSQIFAALKEILASDKSPERDIRVATINAIALLTPNPATDEGKKLLADALDALDEYWAKDLGPGEQLIQAHVPPAIAKLYQDVDRQDAVFGKRLEDYKKAWLMEVEGKAKVKRTNDNIVQSAIVALGRTCEPVDAKTKEPKFDYSVAKALEDFASKGSNEQARYYSFMALGQMGGTFARDVLLDALRNGKKALERPWAAVSLGVLTFRDREKKGDAWQVDELLGKELVKQLEVKNPSTMAAMAIGLGLTKYKEAGSTLQDLLERQKSQDELAGYICIGLALMDQKEAIQMIQEIVQSSTRRGDRLRQAAIALGKLGDKSAAQTLIKMLTEDESGQPDLAKMSAIASALGYIGDNRSIDPLVKMLFDSKLTNLSRAFAAVALGGVADKELLPWNSKISVNMNYRAAVETLTNQQAGILDIL